MANKTKTKKTTTTPAVKPAKKVKETKKAPVKTPVKTKAASKSKPKTFVSTPTSVQSHAVETKKTSTVTTPKRGLKVRRSYIILTLVIVGLAAFLYFCKSWFVAAVVNGQPISRLTVVHESEKQSGKAALNNLVRNALIEQEARKQKVTVSEKEIDEEIKKVETQLSKQGQKLDDVLEIQGLSKKDLRDIIKLDKLVTKMVGKDVKVADKDVAEYMEQNKATLPTDQKEEDIKKMVADRLKQQALNEKVQAWLEGLQKNAKTTYFVQY